MKDIIWKTPSKKRQYFDDQFAILVSSHVRNYKGKQPIISWNSDKMEPDIIEDFWHHLPSDIKQRLKTLINSLNS